MARVRLPNAAAMVPAGPRGCGRGGDGMGVSYYDALLPVREPCGVPELCVPCELQ